MIERSRIDGRARTWTTWAVLALATLGGAALRLYRLDYAELDMDEHYTYMFVAGGPGALLGPGFRVETNPPLYYLLQWSWQIFGTDRFALRTLPATLGILTIPFLYLTARRLVGERAALIAAALLATAPLPLHYSRNIRCYSLLMFAAMASIACFERLLPSDLFRGAGDDLVEARPPGPIARVLLWLGYSLSLLVCLYGHNTMVLLPCLFAVVVGLLVAFGRRVSRGFVGGWVAATGVVVLAYLPWFLISFRQARDNLQDFWITKPTLSRAGLYYIYSQLVGTYPYLGAAKLLAYPLPLIGLWRIRRSPWAATFILVFLVGLPLLTTLIAFYRPILIVRVLFWPSFFFFVLMGSALAWPKRPWVSALGLVAIVGFHGWEFSRQVRRQPARTDASEVVKLLRGRIGPDDAVLFAPERTLPNEIDYEGRDEPPPAVDRFYLTESDRRNLLDDWFHARFLKQSEAVGVLGRYPRVWLLAETRPKYAWPAFVAAEPIIAALKADYGHVEHWRLVNHDVWLYERAR